MHTRFLPIFFGLVFALTLLFAVAAVAQERNTGASLGGGGGVQVQRSQGAPQQQVQVQSNQGPVGTMAVEPQAQGCQGQKRVLGPIGPKSNDTKKDFHIDGGKFRVEYDVNFTATDPDNEFTLNISNGSKFFTSTSTDNNHEEFVIDEGPGNFTLDARLRPEGNGTYTVTVYDCKNAATSNNNGGGGGGGNNDGGTSSGTGTTGGTDTTGTTGASSAQADTTGTTTAETTTAANDALNSLAETTTADNANGSNSDNFRCDLFLHVVQDNNGALRQQYRDGNGNDQLIVQRREQCLSGNVLTNTIPNRKLPFTGGPPLPLGGVLLLLAGLAVLARRMNRR